MTKVNTLGNVFDKISFNDVKHIKFDYLTDDLGFTASDVILDDSSDIYSENDIYDYLKNFKFDVADNLKHLGLFDIDSMSDDDVIDFYRNDDEQTLDKLNEVLYATVGKIINLTYDVETDTLIINYDSEPKHYSKIFNDLVDNDMRVAERLINMQVETRLNDIDFFEPKSLGGLY